MAPKSMQILRPGDTLMDGGYRVDAQIGKGAFGEVYRVIRVRDNSVFALKILNLAAVQNQEHVLRFEREYEVLRKLDHPNIVRVHEYGLHQYYDFELPWFVLDYYGGGSFRERMNKLSPGEGLRLLLPILDALQHAHDQRIFHRDLKPQNILVSLDDFLVLTDFGIARLDDEVTLTQAGRILGTPIYLSPEQCMGVRVNAMSDIYTMGVILYMLCTRRPPFRGQNFREIYEKHIKEPPMAVRKLEPEISPRLEKCIMRCLEKEPADRYKSVDELKRNLIACPELTEEARQKRLLPTDEEVRTRKGTYRVGRLIKQAGFGEVYRVRELKTGIIRALKILRPAMMMDDENIIRFQREIQILVSTQHENIVQVVDQGNYSYLHQQIPFYIMPYYPGNLEAALTDPDDIERVLRVDPNKAMPVILDVLRGLDHAHRRQGIIHRDLKPSNILISNQGRGYLADFGIAKRAPDFATTHNLTLTRSAVGTAEYMAPEQITMENVDKRADIYAMGLILYRIFTGRHPFEARSSAEVQAMQLREQPRPPRRHVPSLRRPLEAVILKCLQKDPARRYQGVDELIRALEKVRFRGTWTGPRPFREIAAESFRPELVRLASPITWVCVIFFILGVGGALSAVHTIRRIERVEAMDRVIGGTASQIPPLPESNDPPELLDPASRERIRELRLRWEQARAAGDRASAGRAALASRQVWRNADRPEIRFADRDLIDQLVYDGLNTRARTADLDLELAVDRPGLDLSFEYELTGGGARADSGKAEGRIISLRGLVPDRSYLLDVKAYLAGSAGGKSIPLPLADFPEGLKFEVRRGVRPVLSVRREGERVVRWDLSAEQRREREFERWSWLLRDRHGIETEVTYRTDGNRDQAWIGIEDIYKTDVPDGKYQLLMRARERGGSQTYDSRGREVVIDRTPPSLSLVGTDPVLVLLPHESRELQLAALDTPDPQLPLEIVQEVAGGADRRIRSGVDMVSWQKPGTGEVFGRHELRYRAIEPPSHGNALKSELLTVSVLSLDEEHHEGWLRTRKLAETLVEGTGRADSRAWRIARDAWEELFPGREAFRADEAMLAGAVSDPSRFFGSLRAWADRAQLALEADVRFVREIGVLKTLAGTDKRRLGRIDEMSRAWALEGEDAAPGEFLSELRAEIVPSLPAGTSEVCRIEEDKGALPVVRLLPGLLADFPPELNPVCIVSGLLSDPPPEDRAGLDKFLAGLRGRAEYDRASLGEDLLIPQKGHQYAVGLWLVLQVRMTDPVSGDTLNSDARAYPIAPLVTVPESLTEAMGAYDRELTLVIGDPEMYRRSLRWLLDAHGFDALRIGGDEGDELLVQEHMDKLWREAIGLVGRAAEMEEFIRGIRGLETVAQGDRALQAALSDEAFAEETAGWRKEQIDFLQVRLTELWASPASGSTDADLSLKDFVRTEVDAYRRENYYDLLTPPPPPAARRELAGGDSILLEASDLGGLDPAAIQMFWEEEDREPNETEGGWKAERSGTYLRLQAPPDRERPYRLYLRTDMIQRGVRVHSKWVGTGIRTRAK